jgi:hypothetical protein
VRTKKKSSLKRKSKMKEISQGILFIIFLSKKWTKANSNLEKKPIRWLLRSFRAIFKLVKLVKQGISKVKGW